MEISISSEQDHLLNVAEDRVMPGLLESGSLYPALFVHNGNEVTVTQFELNADLDELRNSVKQTIFQNHRDCLAYVFAYDTTIEIDGNENDALIMETGDIEDEHAFEFVVYYNRVDQSREPRQVLTRLNTLVDGLVSSEISEN